MDHITILKTALQTTLRHRALWVLGLLWALAGGGLTTGAANFGVTGNPGAGGSGYIMDSNDLARLGVDPRMLIAAVLAACGLLFFFGLLATIVRYVLQAGIYRSLARLQEEGLAPTVREGFRQGWHRRTWRLFLQDLIVGIPLVIGIILLLLLALSPLLLLAAQHNVAKSLGVVAAIGLLIGVILLMIAVLAVINVISQFWWRAATIGDLGAVAAIQAGWRLVRANIGDVAIMWLLMAGIGILWSIIMIPVVLLLIAIAGLIAGGPAFILYNATQSLALALLWGIPVGLLLFILPLVFVSGLYLIFHTSVWNQMYSQLVLRAGALTEATT